jgi:hypothetical protein
MSKHYQPDPYKPVLPPHAPSIPTPQAATPRPSCEPEIRAIADRLRHLIATDNDAARHCEEYLSDVLPCISSLQQDVESAEWEKEQVTAAQESTISDLEKECDELGVERDELSESLMKWIDMYEACPSLPDAIDRRDPGEVEAFIAAFEEWNHKAYTLYGEY